MIGKVYIVTAASAAGQCAAHALLAQGAHVVPAAQCWSGDGWWAVVKQALDRYGRLDGVVHDASLFDPSTEDGNEAYEKQLRDYASRHKF